jgi:23S rRNA (uracil1939-C5)-methyltransferase
VELQIEDVAFGGNGVGRVNGKAVFVPYTIDGEQVSARIVREKKSFAQAELLAVLAASPERITPPCPYFGRCGGCSYQHISYEHQLSLKWHQVQEILRRIGKMEMPPLRPIVPSPLPYEYRNRITVHALDGIVGFYRRDVHQLLDIERCPISMPEVNEALAKLRSQAVPDGHYTLRAQSGPRTFSQINDAVAESLISIIQNIIPPAQQLLIDAYCGSGFFARRLLDKFERVIGIDWDKFAIEAARKNATAKETYIAGDIEVELAKATRSGGLQTADYPGRRLGNRRSLVIIVDPPATGLTASVRKTIMEAAPAMLIYVSCNPPTLARDLAALRERYEIESVTPLDMFPQTAEIEVVAELRGR